MFWGGTNLLKAFLILIGLSFATAANADNWKQNRDYWGSWETTQASVRYSHASKIELELWTSKDGLPEGFATFLNGHQSCTGMLTVNNKSQRLNFSAMEGASCENFDGGYFTDFRPARHSMVRVVFVPPDIQYTNNLWLKYASTYRKLPQPTKSLKSYVDAYQSDTLTLAQQLNQYVQRQSDHDKQTQQIRDRLNHFEADQLQDSDLIGVWRGEFVDQKSTYPAEIMLWSASPYKVRQVVGIVRFDDDQCTTGMIMNASVAEESDKKTIGWIMNPSYLTSTGTACQKVHAFGSVQMDTSKDKIALYFDSQLKSADGISYPNCLEEISIGGMKACVAVGIFNRSEATPELNSALNSIDWNTLRAPFPEDQRILLAQTESLDILRKDHQVAAAQNSDILQRQQRERDDIREKLAQKERENYERLHPPEISQAERIRRNKARWEAQSGGRVVVNHPNISGPFDGLPGASFLNAIYKGNSAAIEQHNLAYQSEKMQRHKSFMGDEPHWSDVFINPAIGAVQLVDTVRAIYLFQFQDQYASCLKKDSVTFEVVDQVPDTSTKNLLGQEIARSYGYTYRQHFRVNREFIPIFRRVGRSKPQGIFQAITDFAYNQGGTDLRMDLITGTKQLMRQFDCHSPEAQQFERNLTKSY
ncbi:hypothetical protein SAMN02745165_03738 [Malonomonas rubra DSM 5091]|uniref:Uncharacterized protein n=1 Tax=Malonomonas rubra DSM 5091 TaxID=1122189 RepID=A0A1M6NYH8_MALRU|nr:hypothetical protein [Malonomonas rubra]SHK00688.1 hypothetical protein SAMN02745165_03738 [Malonomonas rubra DSM 5091]